MDTDTEEDKMALYVNTNACKEDAPIRDNAHLQYEVGVMLMALGMEGITDKSLPEALCRLEFYGKITDFAATDRAWYRKHFARSVGVRVNVKQETWSQWLKRMGDDFRYASARRAELAELTADAGA